MESLILDESGVKVTPIIMGTWQAGKSMWVGITDAESTRAIRAAFEAGVKTFDTAEEYGGGHSERILGGALAHVREEVVYATKVFSSHLRYDQVIEACHRSLKNLQTDHIDLYQIHWPAGSWGTKAVPIEETMSAMTDLKRQGKIRAIGVSNFSRPQLVEAVRYGPIDSLQPPYSLFWRQVETDVLPYCRENGITILAYSPMAQGLLTGKFGPGHKFPKGDHRRENKLFKPENAGRVHHALGELRPIAQRLRVTLGQLALAWVIAQPGTCAVAGARNAGQALENAEAVAVRLSPADLEELERISQRVTGSLGDDPVLWG